MMDNGKITVQEFLNYIEQERGYSVHTVAAYKRDLDAFLNFLDIKNIDNFNSIDIATIRSYLAQEFDRKDERPGRGKKPITANTVARKLASIKSFFKYLVQAEMVADNPALHVKTPKIEKRIPTFIQSAKIENLMNMPDTSTLIGWRDKAILELFYATGIRLSELVGLNIGSVNQHDNTLKVLGKGNKERIVPFGKPAKNALDAYLKKRKQSWTASSETPLFCGRGENRISVRTIQQRLKIYLQAVLGGSDGASPHTLRHTFGTHLLDNDADIRSIQELLGHSSISSTQVYTKVNPQKMKDIYKDAHPHAS